MKNLKSIVATIILTGTLALNSLAGVIVYQKADENTDQKATQCTSEKDSIVTYGVIVYNMISASVGLNGVIVYQKAEPTCDTNTRSGILISD